MEELRNSRAYKTFENFKKMNSIPRCSNDEEKISEYLFELGKSMGLETLRDESLNVLIRKPASPGYEDHETVALQGHMDMVCEKAETCSHDFSKDPIDMYIEEDWIKARGTTLGADDAIGVALGLDILQSDDLMHPALELIITATEETGMDGAIGLSKDWLKAKKLINIDTEDEGVMIVGCAGGINSYVEIPMLYQNQKGYINKKLVISGLKGGHSGLTIGSEHLNAIKLLVNFLTKIKMKDRLILQNLSGGTKHNAIPSKAEAIIGILPEDLEEFEREVEEEKNALINQYLKREPELQFSLEEAPAYDIYLASESTKTILNAINLLPHGINTMVENDDEMVESSNNLAIAQIINDKFKISLSVRSSNLEQKEVLLNKIKEVARILKADISFSDGYPMWVPNFDSKLAELAKESYKAVSGNDLVVKTIHAGLETGLLSEKYPEMDMISIGPSIIGAHTPEERLSISSTERTRDFIVDILSKL